MEKRTITVERPGRLRVEAEKSDGNRSVMMIDGQSIVFYEPGRNVYAKTAAPASDRRVDPAFRH